MFDGTTIKREHTSLLYSKLPIGDVSSYNISDIDDEGNSYPTTVRGSRIDLHTTSSVVQKKSMMAQVPTGQTQLDIYFEAIDYFELRELILRGVNKFWRFGEPIFIASLFSFFYSNQLVNVLAPSTYPI